MAANNNSKSLIVDYSKHRDARVDRQSVSSLRSSSLHVRRTCSSHRRRPIRRRVSANDLEAALAQVDRLLRQPMMHWAQDVGGVVTSVKIGGRAALARTPLTLTPSAAGSTGKTGTGTGSRHGSSSHNHHVGEQQLSKKIHLVPSPMNALNTSLNSQKPTFFGLRSCHHMDETDDEEEEEDDGSVFEDSQSVLSDASSSVATFAADDDDDELLSASCATLGTEATTPLDQSTDTSSSKQDESLRVSFRLKRRDGSDHQRHGQRQDRKSHDRLVDSLTLILAQAEDPKAPTTTMRSNSSKRIFSSSMHAGGSRKGQTDSLHASNGGSTHSTRSLGQRTSMPMVLSPRDARSLRRSFHPPQPRSKSFSNATATTAIANTTAPISRRTLSLKEASVQQQSARHLLRQMSFSKASFKCSLDSTNHLSKKKILPLRSSSSSSSKANSNHNNNSSSNSILTTTSSHGGPTSPTSSNMRRSRSFSTQQQQQQQRLTTSSSIPSNNSMKNPELLFAASRTTTTPLARIRREASIRSTKNLLSEPARRTNRRRGGMSNL
ncbi:expressed unknown protein [Seminavis robusta]|uniref:Uncharacterized protein n=1 Tax=Seminavis robusta TaxID=568900 RepID=A0A9N8HR89_9STRA|nr:expressed unknown protein [Seminavis robusta]|eukprot:Sro1540_g280840.1 n/a (550) ;mRNA; r:3210-4859